MENENQKIKIDSETKRSIEDAQLVAAYIARNGHIEIERDLLETIVKAKYQMNNGQWTDELEIEFIIALDKITKRLSPVTIKSLKATMPVDLMKKRNLFNLTTADINVIWYSTLTLSSLILLIIFQIYSLIGNDLNININKFFNDREAIKIEIKNYKETAKKDIDIENDSKYQSLLQSESVTNEKMDANYELLRRWNSIWQKVVPRGNFDDLEEPPYVKYKHTDTIDRLKEKYKNEKLEKNVSQSKLEEIETLLQNENLENEHYKARLKMFTHEISSKFVLSALSIFVLPLLYGYLGAAAFVLRTLYKEIKDLTFSKDSTIHFRLKIVLGALSGLAIGWFFKPDEIVEFKFISNYALAFLVGYNVEVLFSIMDNIIKSILNWSKKNFNDESSS